MEPLHIGLAERCRLQRGHDGQAALWLYAEQRLSGERPLLGVVLLSDTVLKDLAAALGDKEPADK
ncbi:hypothetical protein AX777_22185 [Sphingobium yanoikuyae]|uniref:Uncharacterized protein n=1 Tax=Sphingobium yanoikuyae TaxID=13690 RepID=A0A177JMY1_SPHYA|nr:hypothetical protein [Sphingobium yanoikuyae]OAH42154.1 hypothetical protein AX777_22185 [Sphingobium yanoikuyae]